MSKEKIDLSEHVLQSGGETIRIYFRSSKRSKLYQNVKNPFLLFDALRKADDNVKNYVIVKPKIKNKWSY
jgi:hypothetical protein